VHGSCQHMALNYTQYHHSI